MSTFLVIDTIKNFVVVNGTRLITTAIIILIAIILLLIMRVIVKKFTDKNHTRRKHAVTLAKLLQSVFRYIVWILSLIIILNAWGIDVTPILAGAGIVALAVSFGAQKLIADFISGLGIVFENYYDVDDVVEIDGFKGRVEEISLRSTKIINAKNEVKIINNGSIDKVINFSKNPSIGVVDIGIAYEEDINKVIKVLEENLESIRDNYPQIIEGPNVVGVTSLEDSYVNIRINVKTLNEQHYEVERGLYKFIKELFDKEGIEIPFNQLVVRHVNSDK